MCDARLTETAEEVDIDEEEPLPVPSFSEACTLFERLKTFYYAHSITDAEKNIICKAENILLTCGNKTVKKQMSMKDYLQSNKL